MKKAFSLIFTFLMCLSAFSQPSGTLDQDGYVSTPNEFYWAAYYSGQTFTCGINGDLTDIEIIVNYAAGAPCTASDYYESNLLVSSVHGSIASDYARLYNHQSGAMLYHFSSPYTLSQGDVVTIRMQGGPTCGGAFSAIVNVAEPGSYSGGNYSHNSQYPTKDMMFRTYMTPAGGGINTWQGNTSQWSAGSNWSLGTAPSTCTDNVLIPATPVGGNFPVIGLATFTVGNVDMQGATLTINGAGGLQVCGNITGTGSGNTITGNSANGLTLTGSAPQTISGNLIVNTLKINNTGSGVTNTGILNINSALILQDGDFVNSGGTVTLKSSASATAYLDNFTSPQAGNYLGQLSVERYMANTANGYRQLSSPVNTTVADLADDFAVTGQNGVQCWYAYNPYPNVQAYDEALNIATGNYYEGWLSYTGVNNPLSAMKGIAVRTYQGSPFTIDFTGAPYSGPQSISITKTPSPTTSQDGWNMIGNPYPSPVLWSQIKALNPGKTDGSQYCFHATGEYAGSWGAHNGTTGVNGATNEIAIGQAFFVLSTANNTLIMDNSVRVANAAVSYYKTNALADEFRLVLSNAINSDEIVAYTDANATANYNPDYDAVKMPAGSPVYLSYGIGNREYAIKVTDAINEQTELPLVLWARDTGNYQLALTECNLSQLRAYLKDITNNTLTELTTTNAPLTLQLNGGETYSGSYSIVFKTATASGITNSNTPSVKIFGFGENIIVQRNSTEPAVISITNLLGQQITTLQTNNSRTEINLPGISTGYVFVKITEGDKVSTSKLLRGNH